MSGARVMIRLVVGAALLMALLSPQSGVSDLYLRAFRPLLRCSLQQFEPRAPVRVTAIPENDPQHASGDTFVVIRKRFTVMGRSLAFIPLALFLSLVLVTPTSLRRRLRAVGIGTAITIALVTGRVLVAILAMDLGTPPPDLGTDRSWAWLLSKLVRVAAGEPLLNAILAVILWHVLAFRHTTVWKHIRSGLITPRPQRAT